MKKLRISLVTSLLALSMCLILGSCAYNPVTEDDPAVKGGKIDAEATEGIKYELSSDGRTARVVGYEGEENNLVISSTYEGKPVTVIGASAFEGFRSLTSVVIPESVTDIEYKAFSGCEWLEYLELPNSVVKIGELAFENCKFIEEIEISSSLSVVGDNAFLGCVKLTDVYVSDLDGWFNISFGEGESNPLCYASSLYLNYSPVTDVILDNGVEEIDEYMLSFSSLETVVIPSSVTKIAKGALSDCTSLISITLPFVGGGSTGTDYIGYIFGADSYMYNRDFVPASLIDVTVTGSSDIGTGAFYSCNKIKEITISGTPSSIGKHALRGCTSLSGMVVPASVVSIGLGAFEACSGLSSLTLPFAGGGTADTAYIGHVFGAASASDNLTSTPSRLETVIITSGSIIGEGAFAGCSSIVEIHIPKSVKTIAKGAFSGCTSLAKLTLPFVGGSATQNTFIGYIFGADNHSKNSTTTPASLKEITLKAAVSIPDYAFSGCSSLTSVFIPMSVTSIGGSAFANCTSLVNILIPYNVTSIGASAFSGCSNLTVKCMAQKRPSGWNISWSNGAKLVEWKQTYRDRTDEGFLYEQKLDCVTISGYEGDETIIVIPASINGATVEAIGDSAFMNNTKITRVTLPDTINLIDRNAFYGCLSLQSVNLPEGLLYIRNCAFYGASITEAIIPKSVESLGISALSYCPNLTKVVFPAGSALTLLDELCFRGSTAIESVYIGDLAQWCSLQFNSTDANPLIYTKRIFVNGTEVKTINIPSGVTTISQYAFTGSAFNYVTLPNTLASISDGAFSGSTTLTAIFIPETVTYIGSSAFSGCSRLSIFCAAQSAPSEWDVNWNFSKRPCTFGALDVKVTDDGLIYVKIDANNVAIAGYIGTGISVTIPETINGTAVTSITNNAFRGCMITRVTVAASVKSIGESAFADCTSLTHAVFVDSEGWRYSHNTTYEGTPFEDGELSDTATAASYLAGTYSYSYWKK